MSNHELRNPAKRPELIMPLNKKYKSCLLAEKY